MKRLVSIVLVVLVAACLLAGCGGGGSSTPTNQAVFKENFGAVTSGQTIVFNLPGKVDDPVTYGLTAAEATRLKEKKVGQIKRLRVYLQSVEWPTGYTKEFDTNLQSCRVELSGVPAGEYYLNAAFIDNTGWLIAAVGPEPHLISVAQAGVNDLGELETYFYPYQRADFNFILPSGFGDGQYGIRADSEFTVSSSGSGTLAVNGWIETPLYMPLMRGQLDSMTFLEYQNDKLVRTAVFRKFYFDIMATMEGPITCDLNYLPYNVL